MAAGDSFNGATGTFSLGGTVYPFKSFNYTKTEDFIDDTDSSSGGFGSGLGSGIEKGTFSCEAGYKEGTVLPPLGDAALILTVASGVTFTGSAHLSEVSLDLEVDSSEEVSYSMSGNITSQMVEVNV